MSNLSRTIDVLTRQQIGVYLGAIAAGGLVGWTLPDLAPALSHAISPVLGALLFVTFLEVPAANLVRSLRPGRFLGAVLAVNFIVVPLVVAGMLTFLPADPGVRLGVLLVLLCPCVDYVIVFSGIAGADHRRLLAATPLLLIAQLLLLPLFLFLLLGSDLADVVQIGPFVTAFVTLIVIPLALAWAAQAWAARDRAGEIVSGSAGMLMVPLMALTLLVVVASQTPSLNDNAKDALSVIPWYAAFLAIMVIAGLGISRFFDLGISSARGIVFSGATRNSLVVLPLALALPQSLSVATVVVVTQTLVELLGMLVLIWVVPRLLPSSPPTERLPSLSSR